MKTTILLLIGYVLTVVLGYISVRTLLKDFAIRKDTDFTPGILSFLFVIIPLLNNAMIIIWLCGYVLKLHKVKINWNKFFMLPE